MEKASTQADIGLVVVHGIGLQASRETLFTWSEPLAARLDLLSRQEHGRGIQIVEVYSADGGVNSIKLSVPTGKTDRTILITEARWADSFLVMSNIEVVRWSVGFAPRTVGRALHHLARVVLAAVDTFRDIGGYGVAALRGVFSWDPATAHNPSVINFVTIAVLIVWGLLGAAGLVLVLAAGIVLVPFVAALAIALLGLAFLASMLPWVGPKVRPLLTGLSLVVGDAGAWTTRPLRAAAMRDVVREAVRAARAATKQVILLGHSQGAAVSAAACVGEGAEPVDVLVTVGGAVSLLDEPRFSTFTPRRGFLAAWSQRPGMRWINAWAMWDPVSSGPIALDAAAARRRWARALHNGRLLARTQAAEEPAAQGAAQQSPTRTSALEDFALGVYGLEQQAEPGSESGVGRALRRLGMDGGDRASDDASASSDPAGPSEKKREEVSGHDLADAGNDIGPEEWPLHNLSSVVGDHITYPQNLCQLIDRLCLLLLDIGHSFVLDRPADPKSPEAARLARERRYVTAVRQLGVFRILCLPVAVALAGALLDTAWGARMLGWLEARANVADGVLGVLWRLVASLDIRGLLAVSALTTTIAVLLVVVGTWLWRIQRKGILWHTGRQLGRSIPFYLFLLLALVGGAFSAFDGGFIGMWGLCLSIAVPFLAVLSMGSAEIAPLTAVQDPAASDTTVDRATGDVPGGADERHVGDTHQ